MKKLVVVGLILGLIAGSLVAPAAAAKKKKKKKPPVVVVAPVPTDVNYYLHRNSCGEATDETTLSTIDEDGEGGDDCGAVESGLVTEVFTTTGQDPSTPGVDTGPDKTTWAATDGVPLVLDATKDIKGAIAFSSFCCRTVNVGISAGQAKMHAVVTGDTAGASKVIGEATVEFTVTPQTRTYVVEFQIQPDAALDQATFTSLELTITNRGASYLHSFYSVDDPASLITVGTLK